MSRRTFDNRVLPDVDLRRPLGRLARRSGPLSPDGREHPAQVVAPPDLAGVAVVVIRGREARASTVGVSTRGVQVGDRVTVKKQGGRWVITNTHTPHAPTSVAEASEASIIYDGNNHTSAINTLRTRVLAQAATINTLLTRLDAERITRRPE